MPAPLGEHPFDQVEQLLELIANGPERWRSQMRSSLTIESTDTSVCPIRRSVYASLLVFALAAEQRYQLQVELDPSAGTPPG